MKTYIVSVPVHGYVDFEVEASSEEEALELVEEGSIDFPSKPDLIYEYYESVIEEKKPKTRRR